MLRPSLLPGLLDACAHNRRRGGRTSGCSRPAAASRATRARAVPSRSSGAAPPTRPHWSTGARDGRFLRLKGVVERVCATLRGAGGVHRLRTRRFSYRGAPRPRRSTRTAHGSRSRSSASCCRRWRRRADSRPRRRSTSPSSTCAALVLDSPRATTSAPSRCRAIRRSCATSRCSSTTPCLRPRSWHYPFVGTADAGFDRRVRSLHGQGRSGRAGQPFAAAHVPGARSHADRRRSADGDGSDRRRAQSQRTARNSDDRADSDINRFTADQRRSPVSAEACPWQNPQSQRVDRSRADRSARRKGQAAGRHGRPAAGRASAARSEENARLARELDAARARLTDAEGDRRRDRGAPRRARPDPLARRRDARSRSKR